MRYKSIVCVAFFFFGSVSHATFIDVDVTHPHFYAIEYLSTKNVIQGYKKSDEVFFKPLSSVLRSEALKILMLSGDVEIKKVSKKEFPDVPVDTWYSKYVSTAFEMGIVNGFDDGYFRPANEVSRAEFLKMLTFTFGVPVDDAQSGEEWYERFFIAAEKYNILIQGRDEPLESLSRGEVVELVYRTIKVAEKNFKKEYVFMGHGQSSYYGQEFAGKTTANGEIYNPMEMTAAHRTLPFGTYLKVYYGDKFVIVRVTDRGPYHEKRVLDLSQKAFSMLAPIGTGVIDVEFEVVLDTEKDAPIIPEYIRDILSTESKNDLVPFEVMGEIESKPFYLQDKKDKLRVSSLFEGTVSHLSQDFFANIVLRKTIPQKIVAGTVFNISGRATELGHDEVTFFLQKLIKSGQSPEQIHFTGKVSDRNFVLPVAFLEPGIYQVGLTFDEEKRSRLGIIEVIGNMRKRQFSPTLQKFVSEINIEVVPEKEEAFFSWTANDKVLTKIIFSQKEKEKTIYIEDGIKNVGIPYSFFSVFTTGENIAVDLLQAESFDETLQNQRTSWKKVVYDNFKLLAGFPDKESEKISIQDFIRYHRDIDTVIIKGKILDINTKLGTSAFLRLPYGAVEDIPIDFVGKDQFRFEIDPREYGTYVVQIMSDKQETLFRRAIYFSKSKVLPIAEWPQVLALEESIAGIRFWTNILRRNHGISILLEDEELDLIAQEYAEEMADFNFISHTSHNGESFEDRIKKKYQMGEFGENLSFASGFQLALTGLENSVAHRKNLLSRKWKHVGIGFAENVKREKYIVQIFKK